MPKGSDIAHYPKIEGRRRYPDSVIKVVNIVRDDIINMIIGGLEPGPIDVDRGWAKFTGTLRLPSYEWNRSMLKEENNRDLLTMYRMRKRRKIRVK